MEPQQLEHKKSFGDDLLTNLVKLKLVRDEKVTLAANLLFGDTEFTIRIRDFLKSYPDVALSVEERGDFFRAELRSNDLSTPQVTRLLHTLVKPLSRRELQEKLGLRDREHFRRVYLRPALKAGLIVMCNLDKPRAADQKYRITEHGRTSIGGKLLST